MCVCIVEETLRVVARKTDMNSTGTVKCCLLSDIMGISGEWGEEGLREPCVVYCFLSFWQKKR